MTVFKTFLKILNKTKASIILYTVCLVAFGGLNMQTQESSMSFESTKPDVAIINQDKDSYFTQNLVNYIESNSNIKELKNEDEALEDAIFYRDINYAIYIPENYSKDFMNDNNPEIKIKSTKDYNASLANMQLEKYLKIANTYKQTIKDETELVKEINKTISNQSKISITSKLDNQSLSKATFYYNFLSYSMLACVIFVICLVLSSFNDEKIKKRTIISSTSYKKHNTILLLSNMLFAFFIYILYILLSVILCGDIMFTKHGLIYLLNALIFTFVTVTIAFLINSLVNNKNAINGIVNVVALGSSFLCGAFVPVQLLPKVVLDFAHILPTYWYINTNETIKTLETINIETLKPILTNSLVLLAFGIVFIIITNIITKKKQKIK